MSKTYVSKNSARLSMFFNDNGEFELDKREVITSLRGSTQEVAKKAVVESEAIKAFNKFNDIEEQLDKLDEEKNPNGSSETKQASNKVEVVKKEPAKSVIAMIEKIKSAPQTPNGENESSNPQNNKERKAVSIQELFVDAEGNEVLTRNSTGFAVIEEDESTVTIRHTIGRDFSEDNAVREKLLNELPSMTTYLASNGRTKFDVESEKERLSYEIMSNINRYRFLSGLQPVHKSSSFAFVTSFEIEVEAVSTMPYLTVREVADMIFKQILDEQYPKLLMDVDVIALNIGKIDTSITRRHIVASIYKDAYTLKTQVHVHLGKQKKG